MIWGRTLGAIGHLHELHWANTHSKGSSLAASRMKRRIRGHLALVGTWTPTRLAYKLKKGHFNYSMVYIEKK